MKQDYGEAQEAKRDGATLQKNSGRGYQKGDAVMAPIVVDYKSAAKSFTINKRIWQKITKDTMSVNREYYPAIKIILGEGNDKNRLWLIEDDLFEQMLILWRDVEDGLLTYG